MNGVAFSIGKTQEKYLLPHPGTMKNDWVTTFVLHVWMSDVKNNTSSLSCQQIKEKEGLCCWKHQTGRPSGTSFWREGQHLYIQANVVPKLNNTCKKNPRLFCRGWTIRIFKPGQERAIDVVLVFWLFRTNWYVYCVWTILQMFYDH